MGIGVLDPDDGAVPAGERERVRRCNARSLAAIAAVRADSEAEPWLGKDSPELGVLTRIIPPPTPDLVRYASERPSILAIQSIITCSSSVQAGEQIHWPALSRSLRGKTSTHIEARIANARRVELAKHAFVGADCREVRHELWVLPVRDSWDGRQVCSSAIAVRVHAPGMMRDWKSAAIFSNGSPSVGAASTGLRTRSVWLVTERHTRESLQKVPGLHIRFDWSILNRLIIIADRIDRGVTC
jgi:hypothetical protein